MHSARSAFLPQPLRSSSPFPAAPSSAGSLLRVCLRLVYPFNASLPNRLARFAVCCSCDVAPRALSRSPTYLSLSLSRSPRAIDRSIDRSNLVTGSSRRAARRRRARSTGLSRSLVSASSAFAQVTAGRGAARSLNRRASERNCRYGLDQENCTSRITRCRSERVKSRWNEKQTR